MLLTYISGLANYTSFRQFRVWSTTGVSESTVLTAISQAPREFTPATMYTYSNSNFFALA
jgi:CubicO group peptidase (beta-lactamase class C family)